MIMPECCGRAEASVLLNLLNNGPQPEPFFCQTIDVSKSAAGCNCDLRPPFFVNRGGIVRAENPVKYMHLFDKVVADICTIHVDFIDIADLLTGRGFSSVAFRQACCTIPRLSSGVFFHPAHVNLVRAPTALNIYDKSSMLAAIGSSDSQGVAERDLGEAYTLAGRDLLNLLENRRVVSIHHRIYSSSIARSRVDGALEAWQG